MSDEAGAITPAFVVLDFDPCLELGSRVLAIGDNLAEAISIGRQHFVAIDEDPTVRWIEPGGVGNPDTTACFELGAEGEDGDYIDHNLYWVEVHRYPPVPSAEARVPKVLDQMTARTR